MTPSPIARLLREPGFYLLARLVLVAPFLESGIAKLIDFQGTVGLMAHVGLTPSAPFAAFTVAVLILASLAILADRGVWIAAGALAVFTALTVPLEHHFWTMTGAQRMASYHTAWEHLGVIGGLMLVCILSELKRSKRA